MLGAFRYPTRSRLKCVGSHLVTPGTFLRAKRGAVWGHVTSPVTDCVIFEPLFSHMNELTEKFIKVPSSSDTDMAQTVQELKLSLGE